MTTTQAAAAVPEAGGYAELDFEFAGAPSWPRGWLMRRALLAADVGGLLLTFAVTEAIYGHLTNSNPGVGIELGLFLLTLPIWVILAKLYGLYDRDETRTDHRSSDDMSSVLHLTTIGTWTVFAGSRLVGIANPDLARVTVFWALAVVCIVLARSVARTICRRHPSYLQNTIVVGSGPTGRLIARKLEQNPQYGLRLLGFVDSEFAAPVDGSCGPPVIGSLNELRGLVRELDVPRVIVAVDGGEERALLEEIRDLNARGVQVDVLPRFSDLLGPEVDVHLAGGVPLWSLRPFRLSGSSLALKRGMDVLLSSFGLVVLMPVFLVVAALIKLDSPGPVLFRQTRIRDRRRTFQIWKFRTMVMDAEERKDELAHLNVHSKDGGDGRMFKVEDDPRTTRVGKVLRRFSIDELPQLVNVLVGEMSLVGPRPLISEEHQHVTEWRRRRLDLRPGITGSWQVNGRSRVSFEEMVALDYRYVTNWSLARDLAIVLKTIPIVLRGDPGLK